MEEGEDENMEEEDNQEMEESKNYGRAISEDESDFEPNLKGKKIQKRVKVIQKQMKGGRMLKNAK